MSTADTYVRARIDTATKAVPLGSVSIDPGAIRVSLD